MTKSSIEMHTCPCGKHENPGRIVFNMGPYIVVYIDAPNGEFLEVRKAEVRDDGIVKGCFEHLHHMEVIAK